MMTGPSVVTQFNTTLGVLSTPSVLQQTAPWAAPHPVSNMELHAQDLISAQVAATAAHEKCTRRSQHNTFMTTPNLQFSMHYWFRFRP